MKLWPVLLVLFVFALSRSAFSSPSELVAVKEAVTKYRQTLMAGDAAALKLMIAPTTDPANFDNFVDRLVRYKSRALTPNIELTKVNEDCAAVVGTRGGKPAGAWYLVRVDGKWKMLLDPESWLSKGSPVSDDQRGRFEMLQEWVEEERNRR